MLDHLPYIVITTGEPAGIGPDIVVTALNNPFQAKLAVVGDPAVLSQRAKDLGIKVEIKEIDSDHLPWEHKSGEIHVYPHQCNQPPESGVLNNANGAHVIDCINTAVDNCMNGQYQAMVTAPVHKALINDAGISFSGHTEWIAERCGDYQPVMMLASNSLRVCLATTHLPLSQVPAAVTDHRLECILNVIHRDISKFYDIEHPVIGVCGLNPHAGENGYLGLEEIEVITPCIERLKKQGLNLTGPLPADTAFTQEQLKQLDAVLAMYHDQGLPVVKHADFGEVVNATLGLPIIRTSVDHGTALDLAGTGRAHGTSMISAIELAIRFANNSR